MSKSMIQKAVESQDPVLARKALREIDSLLSGTSDRNERVYLLFSKSSCFGILGDFNEARTQLFLALKERPEDPDTCLAFEFNRALLLQQETSYPEALEKLTAVLTNNARRLKLPEWQFMYEDIQQRRAFICVTLRRFRDAILLLEEILSFNLGSEVRSDALASLGLCYLELKDWRSAQDNFLKARAIGLTKDREKSFHFYLGIAYFYNDLLAEAKREFQFCEQNAVECELPITDVYRWLSSTCKRRGETVESEHYDRLATLN